MSRYRVAHYGTGDTGTLVLRQLGGATATPALNAIEAVCNASAGVHSALDLVVTRRVSKPRSEESERERARHQRRYSNRVTVSESRYLS
ncbi:MAG: hypothetical protein NVSMB60_01460 [Mycobacterium sp.]